METVVICAAAAITFPVSFLLAQGCLRGVIRLVTGADRRSVLSSQP
jgi:hypothetical protein